MLNWYLLLFSLMLLGCSRHTFQTKIINIDKGYAQTQVNAVIFRKNSVVSHNGYQFVAYYNPEGKVVIAKRKLGSDHWEINSTSFEANVTDAHNIISIMVDGEGYLHMAWGMHGDALNYSKSLVPGSLNMGPKSPMTGSLETKVTYPEFYRLPNGNLIFFYRDGSSGNGNLVMNHYDIYSKSWKQVQKNLIDGEGKRNAYWQMFADDLGTLHLSWVWRETGDVASNHDMCYARSHDEGLTWETSTDVNYKLPINKENAEYVAKIPQNSSLINQTSMTADHKGKPYIATYFKGNQDEAPQFYVIYQAKSGWKTSKVTDRKLDFHLGGFGSKSIPISRPQLLYQKDQEEGWLHLIFRDEELGNRVCISSAFLGQHLEWNLNYLTDFDLNRWEPTYDTELWRTKNILNLFLQIVGQGDGEKSVQLDPQMVGILEVKF